MPNTSNFISKIKLPNGQSYNIHDANAVHTNDITALMDLKGTKATYNILLSEVKNPDTGDVWLISDTGEEYIWDGTAWIKLGYSLEAAGTDHSHNIVSLSGQNKQSVVTGKVTVPTIDPKKQYVSATGNKGSLAITNETVSALGTNATFATTVTPSKNKIKATVSGTSIGKDGDIEVINGLGTPSADNVLGSDTTFAASGTVSTSKLETTSINTVDSVSNLTVSGVSSNSDVTASKVTITNGKAASWTAKVENGELSFDFSTNEPTVVTEQEVTASKIATTDYSVSKIEQSAKTVATGTLSNNGAGSQVATGISSISVSANNNDVVAAVTGYNNVDKATVLTGVKVVSQPKVSLTFDTNGDVEVVTGITSASTSVSNANAVTAIASTATISGAPTITLAAADTSVAGSASVVTDVTVGSKEVDLNNGIAAAQAWEFKSGSTGAPVNPQ